jgi:hypothetical protein
MCEAATQLTKAEVAEHVASLDDAIYCAAFYMCDISTPAEPTMPQLLLSERRAAKSGEAENIVPTEGTSENVAAAPMITSAATASEEGAAYQTHNF